METCSDSNLLLIGSALLSLGIVGLFVCTRILTILIKEPKIKERD